MQITTVTQNRINSFFEDAAVSAADPRQNIFCRPQPSQQPAVRLSSHTIDLRQLRALLDLYDEKDYD